MGGQAHAARRRDRGVEEAAKSAGASGWMAGEGSSIWMNVGAGGHQPAQLGGEDGHEGLRRPRRRRVDLAGAAGSRPDSVNGPGMVTLSGRVVCARRVAELLDDPSPVGRCDGLEDLEAVLLVVAGGAQPTRRRQRPQAGQVR